jgi:hypothetical protein
MRGKAFDLSQRPLDHRLKVDDELFVNRIVCGSERVESGRAGSVENPEHGEFFGSGGLDEPSRARDSASVTAPLQLRASPSTATRDDVHQRDQGDNDHRSDGDDGNGRGTDDHGGRSPRPKCPKTYEAVVASLPRRDSSRQEKWINSGVIAPPAISRTSIVRDGARRRSVGEPGLRIQVSPTRATCGWCVWP